jgi:hypothetical protein
MLFVLHGVLFDVAVQVGVAVQASSLPLFKDVGCSMHADWHLSVPAIGFGSLAINVGYCLT